MTTKSLHLQDFKQVRIGYVPYSDSLDRPGDSRRFAYYASKRGIRFEIADPAKDYDLVVLSARADISVWSRNTKAKLVYDLIDSYLAIPRTDLKGRLRGLLKFLVRQSRYLQLDYWKAIGGMCERADAVVCSTEEQRQDILRYCPNVHVVLDAHMGVTRTVKKDYRAKEPFRLVWEGLPQTLGSLELIRTVLDSLRSKYLIEMHIVTDRDYFLYLGQYGKRSSLKMAKRILPDVRFHEWNEADCAEIICSCDLAVIPLSLEDPFAAGKPENKLLLFWRMGMPVVTSASPAYVRAMHGAGLNFVANSEADWLDLLERLLGDEAARREAGSLGKAYTERAFNEERLLARWDAVFASVGFSFFSRDLAAS
jgi:glycosyltransferase involved in cell wall biosynthesis